MGSIARIRVPERQELEGESLAAYDGVAKARKFPPGYMAPIFAAMANHPGVEPVAALGQFIRESRADVALNELAICVTTYETNCRGTDQDEFVRHRALARDAGLPEE